MKSDISVIMSVYNEPLEVLKKAINSILIQTYLPAEFIIVIDNPNNKEAICWIKQLMLIESNVEIKLLINEKNIGLANSLNRAIRNVTCTYVARMDADDISVSDRLETQFEYIKKNNLDLVGGFIQIMDENEVDEGLLKCPEEEERIKKIMVIENCVKHPTWFLKKEVYDQLNGYRDIHTCEDFDFVVRAILKGKKIGNVSKVCLRYRYNKKSISRTNAAKQQVIRNYIAKEYSNHNIADLELMRKYLNCKKGKREIKRYEKYYSDKNSVKMFMSQKKIWKVICSLCSLAKNSITYNRIYVKIKYCLMRGVR